MSHLSLEPKIAGPSTNWIVGTKLPIGVDNKTLVIDKLKGSGEVGSVFLRTT